MVLYIFCIDGVKDKVDTQRAWEALKERVRHLVLFLFDSRRLLHPEAGAEVLEDLVLHAYPLLQR